MPGYQYVQPFGLPGPTSSHVGDGAAETIPVQHINPLAHYYYAAAGAAVARPLLHYLPERSDYSRMTRPLGVFGRGR